MTGSIWHCHKHHRAYIDEVGNRERERKNKKQRDTTIQTIQYAHHWLSFKRIFYIYTYIYIYTFISFMYVCIYVYMFLCMYVCIYVHMYICVSSICIQMYLSISMCWFTCSISRPHKYLRDCIAECRCLYLHRHARLRYSHQLVHMPIYELGV